MVKLLKLPATPYDKQINTVLSGIQTPGQITATANATALANERAMLAAQKAVSDQTIAAFNNQQTRAEGFSQALGKLQAGEDQQAMARYGQAADRLSGLGAGLTGAVGAGYQSGVDRTRAAVDALTGGLGQVTATPGADIANAAQYTGATMPANTLQDNAVNAARLAQSDASARRENIHQIGVGYGARADDAITQAASDARALIAKRPATIADLVTQLTANRQTGVTNLMNTLNARTTYTQNEQKRKDSLAELHYKQKMDLKQFLLSKGYVEAQTNQIVGNMTGLGPDGEPTFAGAQANRAWEAQKATIAQNNSKNNGFQTDWKGNPAKLVDGHVVPLIGYKVDPRNPLRAVVDKSQLAATSATLHPHGSVSPSLSDRYHVQVYDDGTPVMVNGKTVFYPGKGAKPAKPMTVKDKQAWMLQINTAADNLAKGWTDPGTGGAAGTTHAAMPASEALQQMIKWGYFVSKPLALMAQDALRKAYPDYDSQVALGFKTGPTLSEADPTKLTQHPDAPPIHWDPNADPLVRNGPKAGTAYAKSGRLVAVGAKRYLDSY